MPEKKKQVLWPTLVANKLLRRPLDSHGFIADFPSTEMLLEDDPINPNRSTSNDQMGLQKYKLFVSTWNVGGIPPPDDLNLEDWLDTKNNSYDIYVLGFQEIVPLSARNILGPEKSAISMKWNSVIRATLNKSPSNTLRAGHEYSKQIIIQEFQCIVSKQMVGILVSVWVRSNLQRYIRHTSVSCTGCGIMGCLGNKGAASVRFCLHETSFCFVCCHLASGGKEGDEMHRNSDAMEIFTRTSFPRCPSLDLPQKILDHGRIILLGDLNYRISLSEIKTRTLVEQKEWNILLEKDQLRGEISEGRAFEGWHEGTISFSPTYKYYPNSDTYYGCIQGKKGKKNMRAPAWCDRILWHGKGFKQSQYDRCESRLSDHRPVRAIFTVEVEVPRAENSLKTFFLSERFDQIDRYQAMEDQAYTSC